MLHDYAVTGAGKGVSAMGLDSERKGLLEGNRLVVPSSPGPFYDSLTTALPILFTPVLLTPPSVTSKNLVLSYSWAPNLCVFVEKF